MRNLSRYMVNVLVLMMLWLAACSHEDDHAAGDSHADAHADAHADGHATTETGGEHADMTWDQLALGCAPMGSGASAHIMCNHGHAISLRNEGLYERYLYLKSHGVANPDETQLMGHGSMDGMDGKNGMDGMDGMAGMAQLPPPLTPLLRAKLGEHTRIRVVSYGGTQFHTFHLHGHLWDDGTGKLVDNQTIGPATVLDRVQFYAGAGAKDPTPRTGPGDWMYHCHVEVHALTGMWGLFRVLPNDPTVTVAAADQPDATGRYRHQLPLPDGQPGDTRDVYVIAAEVPLTVARAYAPATHTLEPVQRLARIYVPMPDAQSFAAATAASIAKTLENQAETWDPWVLNLWRGQTVRVHLRNVMADAPVTLHPHGVLYANSEDGTMPDDVAKPGGPPVVMTWKADTAGTWPLHDHARAIENIGRGLFSAIVVQDPAEAAQLQRDYIVFLHDYDMDWMMGSDQPSGSGH